MSFNRPNLSSIAYRLGTFGTFRQQMLDAINAEGPTGLGSLTSRPDVDYSVTLVDLWAAVEDILTFYQERYANDSFLRTAQTAASLASLATLTGAAVPAQATVSAAPAPVTAGASAQAQLLLTVDTGAVVPIPTGLRVQSVPGANEKPQTFETLTAAVADWRFNRLRVFPPLVALDPFQVQRQPPEVLLSPSAGPALSAALKPGDQVVLFTSGSTTPAEEKKLDQVLVNEDRVTLRWKTPIELAGHTQAFKFTRTFRLFGWNAPPLFVQARNRPASPDRVQWQMQTLGDTSFGYPSQSKADEQPPVDHFANPLSVDGASVSRLCLDSRYQGLEVGAKLFVADRFQDQTSLPPVQGTGMLVSIVRLDEIADSFGSLQQTITRVWVNPPLPAMNDRRQVTVYELADEITFAGYADPGQSGAPWTDSVYLRGRAASDTNGHPRPDAIEVGLTITKGAFQPGVVLATTDIAPGRQLILSDANGQTQSVQVAGVPVLQRDPSGGDSRLLQIPVDITPTSDSGSAVAMGNLALVGHGQTVANEVLGSADGSTPLQTFSLQKKPLTYVPDPQVGGLRSTLHVAVNGIRWTEVAGLGNQAPDAEVYSVMIGPDGTVTVHFGDGIHGRIPPSGRSNITATYRFGSGAAGNVRAGSLTTLLDRPPGLLTAINPRAAVGGVDPGSVAVVKQGLGARVRTLGRAVTLQDFEDLAITAGGAVQAQASVVVTHGRRTVFLTIAGPDGNPPSTDDLARVVASLSSAHDPTTDVRAAAFMAVPVVLRASVSVDPGRPVADVLEAARQAALDAFKPDRFGLSHSIHPGDLAGILQAVSGVARVTVLEFRRKDSPSPLVQATIAARGTGLGPGGSLQAAELLVIQTPSQDLNIVQAGGGPT